VRRIIAIKPACDQAQREERRRASQNPYPIYDQNLRFSLPYLKPDQKFDTLFMT